MIRRQASDRVPREPTNVGELRHHLPVDLPLPPAPPSVVAVPTPRAPTTPQNFRDRSRRPASSRTTVCDHGQRYSRCAVIMNLSLWYCCDCIYVSVGFCRCYPAEVLPGLVVYLGDDPSELVLGHSSELGAFGQVPSDSTVVVLVRAPLSCYVGALLGRCPCPTNPPVRSGGTSLIPLSIVTDNRVWRAEPVGSKVRSVSRRQPRLRGQNTEDCVLRSDPARNPSRPHPARTPAVATPPATQFSPPSH